MGSLDGEIEPIYFLITSIGFVILSFLNFRKLKKHKEECKMFCNSIKHDFTRNNFFKSVNAMIYRMHESITLAEKSSMIEVIFDSHLSIKLFALMIYGQNKGLFAFMV